MRTPWDAIVSLWCDDATVDALDASAGASAMSRSEYLRALCVLVATDDERAVAVIDSALAKGIADRQRDRVRYSRSITIRCARETAEALRARAESNGSSISSMLRALASARIPLGLNGAAATGETVPCITDSGVWELSLQIKRIGTNYNQAIHAINAIAAWVRSTDSIDRDEAASIWEILKGVARTNESVGAALEEVADRAGELSDKTGFPLRTGLFITTRRPIEG